MRSRIEKLLQMYARQTRDVLSVDLAAAWSDQQRQNAHREAATSMRKFKDALQELVAFATPDPAMQAFIEDWSEVSNGK